MTDPVTGVVTRRPWTTGEVARARAMRARGLSLAECCRRLGRTRTRNGTTALSRHLARTGGDPCPWAGEPRHESGGRARADAHRAECARLGWPEVTRPLQARALSALAAAPAPLSIRQLSGALGWGLTPSGQPNRRLLYYLRPLLEPVGRWRDRRVMVERLPGRPPTYRVSAWLLARREAEA